MTTIKIPSLLRILPNLDLAINFLVWCVGCCSGREAVSDFCLPLYSMHNFLMNVDKGAPATRMLQTKPYFLYATFLHKLLCLTVSKQWGMSVISTAWKITTFVKVQMRKMSLSQTSNRLQHTGGVPLRHGILSRLHLILWEAESKFHTQQDLYHVRASQVVLLVMNLPVNTGDSGDVGSIPGSGRGPGEGNGSPPQCSCLENPVDRGAWWTTDHGVAESQITNLHSHTHTHFERKFWKPKHQSEKYWGIWINSH